MPLFNRTKESQGKERMSNVIIHHVQDYKDSPLYNASCTRGHENVRDSNLGLFSMRKDKLRWLPPRTTSRRVPLGPGIHFEPVLTRNSGFLVCTRSTITSGVRVLRSILHGRSTTASNQYRTLPQVPSNDVGNADTGSGNWKGKLQFPG